MSASDPGKPIAQIRLRLQLEIQREDQPTLLLEIQRPVACPEVIKTNMVAFPRLDMFGASHWSNASAPGKHPAQTLLPLQPQRHPQRPVHHCDLLPVPPCPEVIETNMVAFLRLDMFGASR